MARMGRNIGKKPSFWASFKLPAWGRNSATKTGNNGQQTGGLFHRPAGQKLPTWFTWVGYAALVALIFVIFWALHAYYVTVSLTKQLPMS